MVGAVSCKEDANGTTTARLNLVWYNKVTQHEGRPKHTHTWKVSKDNRYRDHHEHSASPRTVVSSAKALLAHTALQLKPEVRTNFNTERIWKTGVCERWKGVKTPPPRKWLPRDSSRFHVQKLLNNSLMIYRGILLARDSARVLKARSWRLRPWRGGEQTWTGILRLAASFPAQVFELHELLWFFHAHSLFFLCVASLSIPSYDWINWQRCFDVVGVFYHP